MAMPGATYALHDVNFAFERLRLCLAERAGKRGSFPVFGPLDAHRSLAPLDAMCAHLRDVGSADEALYECRRWAETLRSIARIAPVHPRSASRRAAKIAIERRP